MTLDECTNELLHLADLREEPSDARIESTIIRYLMHVRGAMADARRDLFAAFRAKVPQDTGTTARIYRSICAPTT